MEIIGLDSAVWNALIHKLNSLQEALEKKNDDYLYTPDEAAEYLKITPRTLKKYKNQGNISCCQFNNMVRYKHSDLKEFIKANHIQKKYIS